MIITRSIPVAPNGIISLFLWLSSIPLYMYITSSLSVGHLGCFHVLAIVNSAAVSKSLQAISAGEGVEKREPSYTVGGNAN